MYAVFTCKCKLNLKELRLKHNMNSVISKRFYFFNFRQKRYPTLEIPPESKALTNILAHVHKHPGWEQPPVGRQIFVQSRNRTRDTQCSSQSIRQRTYLASDD